jgi:hypothetical protein
VKWNSFSFLHVSNAQSLVVITCNRNRNANTQEYCANRVSFSTPFWHSACTLAVNQAADTDMSQTDSAANQLGAPARLTDHVAYFDRVWPTSAASQLGVWRGERSMRTFEALPGELNASIISSIINLVCPQCGGKMSQFQCEGRCRRNWLAEWEWANQTTRSLSADAAGETCLTMLCVTKRRLECERTTVVRPAAQIGHEAFERTKKMCMESNVRRSLSHKRRSPCPSAGRVANAMSNYRNGHNQGWSKV